MSQLVVIAAYNQNSAHSFVNFSDIKSGAFRVAKKRKILVRLSHALVYLRSASFIPFLKVLSSKMDPAVSRLIW